MTAGPTGVDLEPCQSTPTAGMPLARHALDKEAVPQNTSTTRPAVAAGETAGVGVAETDKRVGARDPAAGQARTEGGFGAAAAGVGKTGCEASGKGVTGEVFARP